MRSITPSRCGADDWICTSIIRRGNNHYKDRCLAHLEPRRHGGPHAVLSRSAVIRTPSTRFGIWFLSQETTPAIRAPSSDRARFDYDFSLAFQYASLINFDQLSILEACSE